MKRIPTQVLELAKKEGYERVKHERKPYQAYDVYELYNEGECFTGYPVYALYKDGKAILASGNEARKVMTR